MNLLALSAALVVTAAMAGGRASIPGGEFNSVLPSGAADIPTHVAPFTLDRTPVTNAQFLAFVMQHPEWQRGRVPVLLAEPDYLSHWQASDRLGAAIDPQQPVTRVSWFAARAFCEAQRLRLPTWSEWEFVAAAGENVTDARRDAAWRARILEWYAKPAAAPLGLVGQTSANFYGVKDIHGLVWEWVEDFNSLLVSGDSRDQQDPDKLKFCGTGAISLNDRDNYAVLMRIAFLSALTAKSSARSLGFRCASEPAP